MTAALNQQQGEVAAATDVVTAVNAAQLHIVCNASEVRASRPTKAARRLDTQSKRNVGDPLVDGAARLLSIPLRHLYAVLWRAGLLEVHVIADGQ